MLIAIIVSVVLAAIWSAYGPKTLLKAIAWTAGSAAVLFGAALLIFAH